MTLPFPDSQAQSQVRAREDLCRAARRLFAHGHVVGNEGNLSQRLSADTVLCTPTSRSKGDLEPQDLCVVDFQGHLLNGSRRPTSEIQLHLEIYRQRDDVRFVVHAHPPHALAFAVAREAIPQGVLPEIDFFLGEVPMAPYRTPGGIDFAKTIVPFVHKVPLIILASHGTVAYGSDLDLAIANTEMLDRYCYILLQAIQLGRIHFLSPDAVRQMLMLKVSKGIPDPRKNITSPSALFCLEETRGSWPAAQIEQRIFAYPNPEGNDSTAELAVNSWGAMIERIADRVVEKLSSQRAP